MGRSAASPLPASGSSSTPWLSAADRCLLPVWIGVSAGVAGLGAAFQIGREQRKIDRPRQLLLELPT